MSETDPVIPDSTIEDVAKGPREVTVDGTRTQTHSLRELIDAQTHLDKKCASRKRQLPIRIHKIQPGGAA